MVLISLDRQNHFSQKLQDWFLHPRSPSKKVSVSWRLLIEHIFCFDPCSEFVIFQIFQKEPFLWYRPIFKLLILSLYKFKFLKQDLNRKQSISIRVSEWKNVVFHLCIRIPVLRNFQRKPLVSKFSRFSNYRLCFFLQGRHRKPTIKIEFFDERMGDLCSLHQSLDKPKILKSVIWFNSLNI